VAPSRRELFEAALATDAPTEDLRAAVAGLISEGADREEIRAELEAWRAELREQGRDEDEDVVLEVLDFLTGWSSPHMKI
jgi:hypothetical protein